MVASALIRILKHRDSRTLSAIQALDVEPYRALSAELEGVMSAHVVFDEVEPSAATFSSFWLQDVLRRQLQFDGLFSVTTYR